MLLEAKGEFLTPADVAARLKVSLPTVYRLLNPKSPGAPHLLLDRVDTPQLEYLR
jgi:hypothetical protein